ncbi:hypothetical protein ACHQM5_006218 [Ranunculus cassubicifolius]
MGRKIPAINFSSKDLRPGTSSWCSVRRDVHQAFLEYGCFEAVFDEIQLHHQLISAIKRLFDLPQETKLKHNSNDMYKGYKGNIPGIPLYESVAIHNLCNPEPLQCFTDLMWPKGKNSGFSKTVYSYLTQVKDIGAVVMRMICESFGLESYTDSLVESTDYILRLMKYSAPNTEQNSLGLIQHQDKSFFTVLSENQVHGLELQTKDGEWILAELSPSSFIVLIGEHLKAWSNNRLHCPYHRVIVKGDSARYSMGLFAIVTGTIQTPEELVDEEHPLLYKPFDHVAYHDYCNSEQGLMSKSTLDDFCGV